MIGLRFVDALMGALLAGVAIVNARDGTNPRRWNNAAFWGLWAVTFLAGPMLPDLANGVIVIAMVLVAAVGRLGQGASEATSFASLSMTAERVASARRWGNRLFVPALTIPLVAVLGNWALKRIAVGGTLLVDPKQVTLVALGVATLAALGVGLAMLRPPPLAPVVEARRLLDAVGWAAMLPQLLAALGAVFAAAGVGTLVSQLATRWLPLGTPLAAVAAYTLGMALFTVVMGNAFAAFPVMTAGIGLPLLVRQFGGDPAVVTAIGMLSGFCGTLMTPMAANFNIVPVALLDLPDQHAVIKAQLPTGALLLVANAAIMYFLLFSR